MRAPVALSVIWIGGTMLLPEAIAFSFQGLPELGKYQILGFSSLLGAVLFRRGAFRSRRFITGPELIPLLAVASCFVTVYMNRAPYIQDGIVYQAMGPYDGLNLVVFEIVYHGIPFVLGRAFIRSARELRLLLIVWIAATVLYSPLILLESWISPQLHRIVYGFHAHSFLMTRRLGGWRPMVMFPHGLALALWVGTAFVASVAGLRTRARVLGQSGAAAAALIGGVFVLSRSLGAWITVFPLSLAAWALRPVVQVRIALVLTGFMLAYPALRLAHVIPTESIVAISERISVERAESLAFRLDNEDLLLGHAAERWWFGWGGFGRNRAIPGADEHRLIIDSYWLVRIGGRGFVGFLGYALLMFVPVFQAYRNRRYLRRNRDAAWIAAAALIVAAYAIDTIVNGLFVNMPLLVAGGLSSAASALPRTGQEEPRGGAEPPAASSSQTGRPMRDLLSRGRGLRYPGRRASPSRASLLLAPFRRQQRNP